MPIFVSGQDISYSFPTTEGLLDVVAEVYVTGSRLELHAPAVYSGTGKRIMPGVRAILEIARQIEALARLQGLTEYVVTGKRLTGASPGRNVLLRRRIR